MSHMELHLGIRLLIIGGALALFLFRWFGVRLLEAHDNARGKL
jgi:hypothetical protein